MEVWYGQRIVRCGDTVLRLLSLIVPVHYAITHIQDTPSMGTLTGTTRLI